MKKLIAALLAVTTVMSVCTGCGKNSSDDGGSKASVSDSDKKDTKKKSSKNEYSEKDYSKLMEKFIDSAANGDVDSLLKLCLADTTCEPMKKLGMFDSLLEGVADDLASSRPEKVEITGVRDPEDKELKMAEQLYSIFDTFFNKMSELGISYEMITGEEDIPDDKKDALTEAFSVYSGINDLENSDIEPTITFDVYKLVTFEIDGDEIEMPVFKVKGEKELKLDCVFYPTMLGYMKKAEKSADLDPKTVYRAVNSAIEELDEGNINYKGDIIVCSDTSKNRMGKSNADDIAKLIETTSYYADLTEFGDYLFVIRDMVCIFAATEKNGKLTVYPAAENVSEEVFDAEAVEGCETLDELYEVLKKDFG